MGTNFYCRHIPTEKEHQTLQELLSSKEYAKLQKVLDEIIPVYHIGKRSCGWQFLFQASDEKENPEYRTEWDISSLVPWDANLESLKEYLQRDDIVIYDEYGTVFTFDQLWNEEIGESLYNNPDKYMNIEQYYQKTPEITYHFDKTEFVRDGLRFETRWFE